MHEIGKFDVNVNVIPNELEKCMVFTVKNLVLIDSMWFMNSGLDALVKNLIDNDFRYLTQEFNGEQLNLAKQKFLYPYEYINSFEKFSEDKLLDRYECYSFLKDRSISKKMNLSVKKMGISVKKIIYMQLVFGMCLKWIQWVIIMIFI